MANKIDNGNHRHETNAPLKCNAIENIKKKRLYAHTSKVQEYLSIRPMYSMSFKTLSYNFDPNKWPGKSCAYFLSFGLRVAYFSYSVYIFFLKKRKLLSPQS